MSSLSLLSTVFCIILVIEDILSFQSDRDRDTGRYTIRLTCEAGTFEASANVNVLDVPLKPRSLVPDEVRAEHVKLSWQPPADDGGTPITNYLVRYMDIDTGEWVTSCTVSLSIVLKNIKTKDT